MDYSTLPQRTIFIREEIPIEDNKESRVVAVKSDWQDRNIITNVPGRRWVSEYKEWWFHISQIDLIIKELPYYRLHSSARRESEAQEARILAQQTQLDTVAPTNIADLPSDLFDHQKKVVAQGLLLDAFCLFMDTGTGKTRTMIEILKRKPCHRWLVVCPLSLVRSVWLRELHQWHPEIPVVALWAPTNNRSSNALSIALGDQGSLIHVINFATFRNISEQLVKAQESFTRKTGKPLYGGLIVDESSVMKNQMAKQTQALLKFGETVQFRYVMSGCPAPNSPLEYFSQLKLINAEILGDSFYAFRDRWFNSGWQGTKWTIGEKKSIELVERIRRVATFVKKEDCLDLPGQMVQILEVPMSKKQTEVYASLRDYFAVDIEDYAVVTPNVLAQAMKLRQVTSGFVMPTEMDEDAANPDIQEAMQLDAVLKSLGIRQPDVEPLNAGDAKKIPVQRLDTSKTEELVRLLTEELASESVIVWCQFHEEFAHIKAALDNVGISNESVNGLVPNEQREPIFQRFRDGTTRVLLAHPRACGHGVTLINCRYVVYYSLSYSYEEYKQSKDRVYRIGQVNKVTYYILCAVTDEGKKTIDHVLVLTMESKGNVADATTEYLKGEWTDEEGAA